MWYQRLKWVTFAVAAAALLALQFVFFNYTDFFLGPMPATVRIVLRSIAVLVGVFAFNEYVFYLIARIHDALDRERERLTALHQASQGLASLVGLERNLAPTLELVRHVVGADVVGWVERDASGSNAACRLLVGERLGTARAELRFRLGQGLAGRALSTGRTVVVDTGGDLPGEDRRGYTLMRAEQLRAAVAAPAGSGRSTVGALVAGWRRAFRVPASDLAFLENVANQMGVAVENWRLYRETQRVGALEERDRLAREMHDGLAQTLTYLKLKAEASQQHAAAGRWAAVAKGLEDIRLAAVETLGDVRQSIVDLRAAGAGGEGTSFLSHLAEYLHTWSKLNDIEVELVTSEEELRLDDEAALQVMRIIQEALANVRKHAGAHSAWVRVSAEDGVPVFVVDDDGHGFEPGAEGRPGHFGLTLMRERADSIGATIDVQSRPGDGTRIVLRLPPEPSVHLGAAVG